MSLIKIIIKIKLGKKFENHERNNEVWLLKY